ncbi:glycosyl hydrolase family 28-related protein [Egbenema bharatensis]|uniref:glycosyl hydrolase family 28-related protein n=1 Tax=Egbenema bharatensis TaxID=3463334 RepID=UPI003A86B8F7
MLRRTRSRSNSQRDNRLRRAGKVKLRTMGIYRFWIKLLVLLGLFGLSLLFYLHSITALWHSPEILISDTDSYSTNHHLSEQNTPVVISSLVPIAESAPEMDESTVDVMRDFGAKGDGITDDTQAIQQAIDTVYQRGGGTIVFPPGTYLVTSVTLKENMTYYGYGATIKRPPHQDKWTRTFTTHYAGSRDSQPLIIKGFTFDGNQSQQGAYQNYELEQAHLLFLMGDPQFPGRLKVVVEDCVFQNAVADGISVYTNVDIQVKNCEAIDVFRGGFVLTGGNTRAEVSNLTTRGDRNPGGLDIEVDGRGYGNTLKTEIKLENIHLIDGDFDIGVAEGSTVVGTHIASEAPFTLYGLDSTMQFTHSSFKVGAADGYINRIVFPHDIRFEDCELTVTHQPISESYEFFAAADVWWQHPSQPPQSNQKLAFKDCTFQVDSTIQPNDLTYAVYLRSDAESNNNQLVIEGGSISDRFSAPVMQESLT